MHYFSTAQCDSRGEWGFICPSLRHLASSTNYGEFLEDNNPHYLGVAKDAKTHCAGKLFFVYYNPLIKKSIRFVNRHFLRMSLLAGTIPAPKTLFNLWAHVLQSPLAKAGVCLMSVFLIMMGLAYFPSTSLIVASPWSNGVRTIAGFPSTTCLSSYSGGSFLLGPAGMGGR